MNKNIILTDYMFLFDDSLHEIYAVLLLMHIVEYLVNLHQINSDYNMIN